MTQKRITSKDIEIAFLINNIDGVKDLFEGNKTPGKKVLNTAVESLEGNGLDVDDLAAYSASLYPSSGKGRGKQQPMVGDIREYSVQKVKKSAPFIRLPLSTLNVSRGEMVNVMFENGEIRVQTA